jgi:hypothetical protein
MCPASGSYQLRVAESTWRVGCKCVCGAVGSASTTTGNSSPFARWTVMRRTPSVPSSTTGASLPRPAARRLEYARRRPGSSVAPASRSAARDPSRGARWRAPARPSARSRAGVRARRARGAERSCRRWGGGCGRGAASRAREGLGHLALVRSAIRARPCASPDPSPRGAARTGVERPCAARYAIKDRRRQAKKGPRSAAKTESSSSGHSIARARCGAAITSSRSWKTARRRARAGCAATRARARTAG